MEKVTINGKEYEVLEGDRDFKHGDKYYIGDSHVKTYWGSDLECIEDRNNGAIKLREL